MKRNEVFAVAMIVVIVAFLTIGAFLHFEVRNAEAKFQDKGGYPSESWSFAKVRAESGDKDWSGLQQYKNVVIRTSDGVQISYERSRELKGMRLIVRTPKGVAKFSTVRRGFMRSPISRWQYPKEMGSYVSGIFEIWREPEVILATSLSDLEYATRQGKELSVAKQDRLFAAIQLVRQEAGI